MTRIAAAVAVLCMLVSPASAKDVCVSLDGFVPGMTVLIKNVKGKGAFGPVHGYVNHPDPNNGSPRLGPVSGQAITSEGGALIVGLTWFEVALYPNGSFNVLNDLTPINLGCQPGSNGKLDVSDTCDAFVAAVHTAGQVISCKNVVPIP